MDNRLFNITTRPAKLRSQDLPMLAKALVGYYKGLVVVKTGRVNNIGYVRLETPSYHLQILNEDWVKILPYIETGDFDQSLTKAQLDYMANRREFDGVLLDNSVYYQRILGTLETIFTEEYPEVKKPLGVTSSLTDNLQTTDEVTVEIL